MIKTDVAIIGAGPSGTIAAAYLLKSGLRVTIIEKEQLPRFVIGESLLPQCMDIFSECNLLPAIQKQNFQKKWGANFVNVDQICQFSFSQQYTIGFNYTYQVERSIFDQTLANEVIQKGAKIFQNSSINQIEWQPSPKIYFTKENKNETIEAKFILDASGYGRVLANQLQLNLPPSLTEKTSLFNHLNTNCNVHHFDQDYISIILHPKIKECWYWLIPFSANKCSLGAVSTKDHFDLLTGSDEQKFIQICKECPALTWVNQTQLLRETKSISGYTRKVKNMAGDNWALLGNAGDFLDPVFSSGVTIAAKSAQLASKSIVKQLKNNPINWQTEYAQVMEQGINVFKAYIEAWYRGDLKSIFFHPKPDLDIKSKICSILAGYVWDTNNSLTIDPDKKVKTIARVCQHETA